MVRITDIEGNPLPLKGGLGKKGKFKNNHEEPVPPVQQPVPTLQMIPSVPQITVPARVD